MFLTKHFQLSGLDIYNLIHGYTAIFISTDVNEFRRGGIEVFYYLFRRPAKGRNRAEKINVIAYGNEK
jgi:hypothetical protein